MKSTAHNSPTVQLLSWTHDLWHITSVERKGRGKHLAKDVARTAVKRSPTQTTSDQQFSQEEIVCELRGDVVIWFKKRKQFCLSLNILHCSILVFQHRIIWAKSWIAWGNSELCAKCTASLGNIGYKIPISFSQFKMIKKRRDQPRFFFCHVIFFSWPREYSLNLLTHKHRLETLHFLFLRIHFQSSYFSFLYFHMKRSNT